MTKEYKAYKFFAMVFCSYISSIVLLFLDGSSFILYFSFVFLLMISFFLYEIKILRNLKQTRSFQWKNLLNMFFFLYPMKLQYEVIDKIDFWNILILQLVFLILFFSTFCMQVVEPKSDKEFEAITLE